jgi:hypothetical protein
VTGEQGLAILPRLVSSEPPASAFRIPEITGAHNHTLTISLNTLLNVGTILYEHQSSHLSCTQQIFPKLYHMLGTVLGTGKQISKRDKVPVHKVFTLWW